MRFTKHLGIAALTIACAACVNSRTIFVPNPVVAGAVQTNRIANPDTYLEGKAGLPRGSLAQEAVLTAADAQKVCFDLVLRTSAASPNLATLQGWRVYVLSDRGEPIERGNFAAPGETESSTVQGTASAVRTRTETKCATPGENCSTKQVAVATPVATTVGVKTGTGSVCFPNKGVVTKSSYQLELHLDDPEATSHQLAFVWAFR
jgi:hypothetical protein